MSDSDPKPDILHIKKDSECDFSGYMPPRAERRTPEPRKKRRAKRPNSILIINLILLFLAVLFVKIYYSDEETDCTINGYHFHFSILKNGSQPVPVVVITRAKNTPAPVQSQASFRFYIQGKSDAENLSSVLLSSQAAELTVIGLLPYDQADYYWNVEIVLGSFRKILSIRMK
jgi:hypothetical protein